MLIPKSLEEDHDEKILVFLNFLLELLLLGKLWQSNARKNVLIEQLQRNDSVADQEKEG